MRLTPLPLALAFAVSVFGCAQTSNSPSGPALSLEVGSELNDETGAGERVADVLTGLDGQVRSLRFTLPGHRDPEEGDIWALQVDNASVECRSAGPVPIHAQNAEIRVRSYNHLLIYIANADATKVRCEPTQPIGSLILEGRFRIKVEAIPTANAVTLTALEE